VFAGGTLNAGGDILPEVCARQRRRIPETDPSSAKDSAILFVWQAHDIPTSLERAQQPKDRQAVDARGSGHFLYAEWFYGAVQPLKD
jgi:hypothetical protein